MTDSVKTDILGELNQEEMDRLVKLQQQNQQAVMRLGLMTHQMLRQHKTVEMLEGQVQALLNGAGDRLGIERGTPWSVTGDGKIVRAGMPVQPPVQEVVTSDEGDDAPEN